MNCWRYLANVGCFVGVSTQDVPRKFTNWASLWKSNGFGISTFEHTDMLDFSTDGQKLEPWAQLLQQRWFLAAQPCTSYVNVLKMKSENIELLTKRQTHCYWGCHGLSDHDWALQCLEMGRRIIYFGNDPHVAPRSRRLRNIVYQIRAHIRHKAWTSLSWKRISDFRRTDMGISGYPQMDGF